VIHRCTGIVFRLASAPFQLPKVIEKTIFAQLYLLTRRNSSPGVTTQTQTKLNTQSEVSHPSSFSSGIPFPCARTMNTHQHLPSRPLLHHPALSKHNAIVRLADRLQTMRDRDDGALPHLLPQNVLDTECGLEINRRRCLFVENQDPFSFQTKRRPRRNRLTSSEGVACLPHQESRRDFSSAQLSTTQSAVVVPG
jgi:hypothetical protein